MGLRDETEFQALMGMIDQQLRSESVPIHARPMRAQSLLAIQLGEAFVHPYPRRPPAAGSYTGHDLTIRVSEWFDQQYGERLKMDLSPGSIVVLIRGDAWVMRLPRFFGSWDIVTEDPPESLADGIPLITQVDDEPVKYNCLRCVVDMPDAFRKSLSLRERAEILTLFRETCDAFNAFEGFPPEELIVQARADVDAAVGHLAGRARNPALSKWSSLQVAEKALKAYVRLRGQTFRQVHDLCTVAEQAERLGLPVVSRRVLAELQCEPRIRYGEVHVPLVDAVKAHHRSLALVRHIAKGLGVRSIFVPPAF